MSFRCDKCKKVASKPRRVVIRQKMVEHWGWRQGEFGPEPVVVGVGPQIVQEANHCNSCAG